MNSAELIKMHKMKKNVCNKIQKELPNVCNKTKYFHYNGKNIGGHIILEYYLVIKINSFP